MFGGYNAKQYFKSLNVKQKPVAIFSSEIHYGVKQGLDMLEIRTFHDLAIKKNYSFMEGYTSWPSSVTTNSGDNSIDIKNLEEICKFFAEKGHPLLIYLVIGSTRGHILDNVSEAGKVVEAIST